MVQNISGSLHNVLLIRSYLNKTANCIKHAWYAVDFCWYWYYWLPRNHNYTLKSNFITSNAYYCIELRINAHFLITFLITLHDCDLQNSFYGFWDLHNVKKHSKRYEVYTLLIPLWLILLCAWILKKITSNAQSVKISWRVGWNFLSLFK